MAEMADHHREEGKETAMGTHHGHTTLNPETTITVGDAEHTDLVRWGVWVDDKAAPKEAGKRKRNRSKAAKDSTQAKDEGAGEAPEPDAGTGVVVAEDEAKAQEATK